MKTLAAYLIKNHYTIASAESFTVGGFASLLGSIPGISKVYRGSVVTYQTEMKERVLKIERSTIETYGVVSREVALSMAKQGQWLFDSDICISFTGNSGPDPMEGKPVGLCYMAIAFGHQIFSYELHLSGNREEIKNQAITFGVEELKKVLEIDGKREEAE